MNGTLRMLFSLAERVDAIFLDPDRFALIPQEVRGGSDSLVLEMRSGRSVPVKKIVVID